jgi:outer membrane protein assembly factor BamA
VRKRFFISLLLTLLPPFLVAQVQREPEGRTTKVVIQRVIFSKPTLLSQKDIAALTSELRGTELQFAGITWREDFVGYGDEFIRRAYQDRGFFLAKVSCEVVRVGRNSGVPHVKLFVSAHEGIQYRLREIHWKNMTVFPESQLLALMPINPGDIFKRVKIAEGLDAVARLYRSRGYINSTYILNTVIDEATRSIALEIDVDEGGMFHWADLHVEGMSEADKREPLLG